MAATTHVMVAKKFWRETIQAYLAGKKSVSLAEVWTLVGPKRKASQPEERKLTGILRSLGCESVVESKGKYTRMRKWALVDR